MQHAKRLEEIVNSALEEEKEVGPDKLMLYYEDVFCDIFV